MLHIQRCSKSFAILKEITRVTFYLTANRLEMQTMTTSVEDLINKGKKSLIVTAIYPTESSFLSSNMWCYINFNYNLQLQLQTMAARFYKAQ